MAQVTVVESGEVVRDRQRLETLLLTHGVEYQQWPTDSLPACVAARETLDADQKQSVLDSLKAEVQALIDTKGYRTADIVVLSSQTPNLEDLLVKFRKEHYHTEDEVRFVVDGEGVFTIRGKDGKLYDVLVQKGDLLIVPAGTWHWFDLTESRRIKCVRIFQTTEGWQALFKEETVSA